MWLELSDDFGAKLHHRDVIGIALRRLREELDSCRPEEVVELVNQELEQRERPVAQESVADT